MISYYFNSIFAAQLILFCAIRATTIAAPSCPFLFEQTTAQTRNDYSLVTGYFTPQLNGTYVFHLSTGLLSGTQVHFNVELGNSLAVDLYRSSTVHNGQDIISRDFIFTLAQGSRVYLNLMAGTAVSDAMKQTSWSAFLLDDLMYPVITFFVGLNSSSSTAGKIDFTSTIVNVGNAWDSQMDMFTAPQNGIYVFSLSCGAVSGQAYDVLIFINNIISHEMTITKISHSGEDMASRTIAVQLAAGDIVDLRLQWGSLFSSGGLETSFAGFLYEPVNGQKVIWSVHQTNNIVGQCSPFPFNDVTVNFGNGWNTTSNSFVVPFAGVYQLHFTVTLQPFSIIDFRLIWNNVAYTNIFSDSTVNNGVDIKSRSIMIKASVGDTLYLSTTGTANLFSTANRLISFTGLLISL